nr:uncharacterized protein LOC104847085 [Loxodonta africana]
MCYLGDFSIFHLLGWMCDSVTAIDPAPPPPPLGPPQPEKKCLRAHGGQPWPHLHPHPADLVPALTQCPLQVSLSPALCALLLALLGVTPGRAGLRACSVPDVLRHYRAVIFEDLQAAVRRIGPRPEGTATGARHLHFTHNNLWRERAGASCGAQKEHSILLSITSLGRTLRGAVSGRRRGALEKAAWTVAVRTEAVMRRHCWTPRQRSPRRPETPPAQRRGGRRRLLLRALDAVATCWEKLFALRAAAAGGS